ncbi:MAG: ABC transporter ATP-binding protein [Bifidobacteriaceae bacterium]|nr:ABC transporter ATP-binding protein [Bifidobacteriaceae bacterium]
MAHHQHAAAAAAAPTAAPAVHVGEPRAGVPGPDTVLTLRDVCLDILTEDDPIPILRHLDLTVDKGQIQGLAGESGSGKTMTGLAIMGLEPPQARVTGEIWLGDENLAEMRGRALARVRGRRIGMVFQDPSTSLHPQLKVGHQLTDHARYHLHLTKSEARDRAVEMLERVGVPNPRDALDRYPHEFSGGQRQRIAIAIALMCKPELLIADEPTTALDVTVQAGVLHLIRDLVDTLGLAVLFITHDLGVMSAVADTVAVMRHGRIVERGHKRDIFVQPRHPYTKALLAALPGAKGGLTSREDLRHMDLTADPEIPDTVPGLDADGVPIPEADTEGKEARQ